MPDPMHFGTAALTVCYALALASPGAHAEQVSPYSPAIPVNSSEAAAIADRVPAALKAEPQRVDRQVAVSVTNGVARSGGSVYSSDAIWRADEIARNRPRVSRIENQTQLEHRGPTYSRAFPWKRRH